MRGHYIFPPQDWCWTDQGLHWDLVCATAFLEDEIDCPNVHHFPHQNCKIGAHCHCPPESLSDMCSRCFWTLTPSWVPFLTSQRAWERKSAWATLQSEQDGLGLSSLTKCARMQRCFWRRNNTATLPKNSIDVFENLIKDGQGSSGSFCDHLTPTN